MLKNYFKVAYRNFIKESLYSFINITGLAIGIACSLLIYLYVADELSYDQYHSNADRIYRVNEFFDPKDGGSGERSSSIPFPMGETMVVDFPNIIEESVRFFDFQAPMLTLTYEPTEKEFNERKLFFVDSTFHKLFDWEMVQGDVTTALDNPNSIIITEGMVEKYFGNEDPMGKMLRFQNQTDLMVTGIMKDTPSNTHFEFDFLVSFSTLRSSYGGQLPTTWYWNPCWTYVMLSKNTTAEEVEAQLPDFVQSHLPDFIKDDVYLKLQPLTDIHLKSNLEFEIEPNSSESNIYLFAGIAIFVLLIACINFMNLSTARSLKRAKEVGMRKALGSQKHQLVMQFLLESVGITFIAVIFSIGLVYATLPWFNELAEKALWLDIFNPIMFASLTAIGVVVGLVSGIYPALVLTSFSVTKVLKSDHIKSRGLNFRKVLVVLQFAISIMLIVFTGVAVKQLDFLQTDETGFQKEHIVMIPVIKSSMSTQYENYREEALKYNGIENITAVEDVLGAKYQGGNYQFEGMETSNLFSRFNIRHDFLQTFDIPLLAGRDYNRDIVTDDSLALIVNESLVRSFGWTAENAIGKSVSNGRHQGRIVGVVRDYNFASKHEPIGSLVITLNTFPGAFNLFMKYMAVKVSPNNVSESIATLEEIWKERIPDKPFEYFFLDDELQNLYKAESNLSKVATTFSILAIVVACLGLFGLAAFNAEQRKKEIGIRKVLGSSVAQIILMIFSDYSKLLFVAIVISCPIAYFALESWLNGFAYRISMPISIFFMASLLIVIVALLTVSYKSFSAAQTNPVDSLKQE